MCIVKKDFTCDEKEIRFHIKYNNNLLLKEYADLMLLINKSINDINRNLGISNRVISNYATEINSIKEGSIIIETLVKIAKDKDTKRYFFLPLLVGLIINNASNKNNYDHQNNINIYIDEGKIDVIEMGKEYESEDGAFCIKVVNEKTIEIRINN